jgi:hypothetical protein
MYRRTLHAKERSGEHIAALGAFLSGEAVRIEGYACRAGIEFFACGRTALEHQADVFWAQPCISDMYDAIKLFFPERTAAIVSWRLADRQLILCDLRRSCSLRRH